MKSTMFLQNVTVIDHAFIDHLGRINGMSYNLCLEITGEIDDEEQVVIDFSGCKKEIKHLVDDSEYALDHRLVIVDGYSDCFVYPCVEHKGRDIVETPFIKATSSTNDWHQIINVFANIPLNCEISSNDIYKNSVESYLEDMLLKQLSIKYPVTNIEVHLSESFDIPLWVESTSRLQYAHGLKSSTSYGCQNIVHGHLSFIGVDVVLNQDGQAILDEIAQAMTGYIVWDENIKDKNDSLASVAYESNRGVFVLDIADPIIIPTETTVENLAAYVATTFKDKLELIGATRLWVSEGLSKGAVIDL